MSEPLQVQPAYEGRELAMPGKQHHHLDSYARYALTIGFSTLVMFGLMHLNTYEIAHVEFSQTRAWMAIVMGCAMPC